MPWGDRTGPWGRGPMTGRAAGYCAGFPVPGFMNPLPGRFGWDRGFGRGFGFGRGRGFGRGFGWRRFYLDEPVSEPTTLTKEEQKKILEAELKEIETEKEEIEKRLKEIK